MTHFQYVWLGLVLLWFEQNVIILHSFWEACSDFLGQENIGPKFCSPNGSTPTFIQASLRPLAGFARPCRQLARVNLSRADNEVCWTRRMARQVPRWKQKAANIVIWCELQVHYLFFSGADLCCCFVCRITWCILKKLINTPPNRGRIDMHVITGPGQWLARRSSVHMLCHVDIYIRAYQSYFCNKQKYIRITQRL